MFSKIQKQILQLRKLSKLKLSLCTNEYIIQRKDK